MRAPLLLAALGAVVLLGCPSPRPPEPPPPAPVIVDFRASAEAVPAGSTVTLSWETRNATQVEINDSVRGKVSGGAESSGTVELTLEQDSLFVLTATNARGVRDSAVVSVRLDTGAKGILFFASPSLVDAGSPTELAWSAPGARSVSLKAKDGVEIDVAGQLAQGRVTVSPEADTDYELTIDGRKHTTRVNVRPVVVSLTTSPAAAVPGMPFRIDWLTRGATRLKIEALHSDETITLDEPAQVADGSHTENIPADVNPASAFSWRITAFGTLPEAVTVRELQVYVSGTPRILDLTAPRYAREGDSFVIGWKTAEADEVFVEMNGEPYFVSPDSDRAAQNTLTIPTPAQATTFTVRAINHRGGEDARTFEVSPVGVPSVGTFTATPGTVTNGGMEVTLQWNVAHARHLRIVANGKYTVVSRTGTAAQSGTISAYPNADTTYTLEADNGIGDQVRDQKTVMVVTPARLEAHPAGPVVVDTPLDLSWTVGNNAPIQGFPHSQVEERTGTTGFVDIRSTGNRLAFAATADDGTLSFDPEFETWLYGQRAPDRVFVSTNGFLVFGNSASARSGVLSLPSSVVEKFFVAPLWSDLKLTSQSGIYWQVIGDAPEKTLIVQWDQLEASGATGTTATFQAQIHQTGVISFEYQTVNVGTKPFTVGIQGDTAAHGLQYATVAAPSDMGVTFFGPIPAPVNFVASSTAPVGGWVKIGTGYIQLDFSAKVISRGDLRITEAMYSPAAPIASTGEWLEVYNTTRNPLDIAGWSLDFGNGVTHQIDPANGTTVIPPYGTLVLGQTSDPALNDGVPVQYVYGTSLAMDDTAGSVSLLFGSPVSTLTWSAGLGGVGTSVVTDPTPTLYSSGAKASNCSGTTPFGSQSPQQRGTPGQNRGCFNYTLSSIPENFEDIFTTGTVLLGSASQYSGFGSVTLPVPFTYFGNSYTSINLSMVGFATFGPDLTAAYDVTNDVLPATSAPNGVLAVFWDRIVRNSGNDGNGRLLMERKSNYTIISWQDFRIYAQSSSHLNFQLKLFDNGVIEYHYGTMNPGTYVADFATGGSATVWIESPDGTAALPYSINTVGGVLPNTALRFTPN